MESTGVILLYIISMIVSLYCTFLFKFRLTNGYKNESLISNGIAIVFVVMSFIFLLNTVLAFILIIITILAICENEWEFRKTDNKFINWLRKK